MKTRSAIANLPAGKKSQEEKKTLANLGDIDKTALPIKEEQLYPDKNTFFDEDPPIMKVGTIIVRPLIVFNSGTMSFGDVEFQVNGVRQKTRIFRAYLSETHFTQDWVVQSHDKKGMVCFLNEKLPENWIAFQVTSVTKKGKSATVVPIEGTIQELADKYYNLPEPVQHSGIVAENATMSAGSAE